jgi:Tol biopolymer transport system component
MPISELNPAFDESDPWLSADGNYILFTSNRSGDVEIYEAQR